MKILENEIQEKIKIFEKQNVIVEFDNILEAKFEMHKIHINYNRKNGFLNIAEASTNNEIKLNIASAYRIDLTDNIFKINLDNSLDFKIMIKSKSGT